MRLGKRSLSTVADYDALTQRVHRPASGPFPIKLTQSVILFGCTDLGSGLAGAAVLVLDESQGRIDVLAAAAPGGLLRALQGADIAQYGRRRCVSLLRRSKTGATPAGAPIPCPTLTPQVPHATWKHMVLAVSATGVQTRLAGDESEPGSC